MRESAMADNYRSIIANLKNLKAYYVTIANQKMAVYYDPDRKIIYPADKYGRPTGKQAYLDLSSYVLEEVTFIPIPEAEADESAAEAAEAPAAVDSSKSRQRPHADDQTDNTAVVFESMDFSEIPAQEAQSTAPAAETGNAVTAGKDGPNTPADAQTPHGRKKHMPTVFGMPVWKIGVVALMLFVVWFTSPVHELNDKPNPDSGTESTQQTEAQTAPTGATRTELEDNKEPAISVLTASTALLPGHVLESVDFTPVDINAADFRSLTATVGIYTDDERDALSGLFVTQYIAKGQYISYANVDSVFAPANPWSNAKKTRQFRISPDVASLNDYMWGTVLNITVQAEKVVMIPDPNYKAPAADPSDPTAPKETVPMVESRVTDTAVLENVTVVDALDDTGNTLYPSYYAMAAIPDALLPAYISDQYPNSESAETIIPQYLCLALTEEQAQAISQFDQETMTVTVIQPVSTSATNANQVDAYRGIQTVASALVDKIVPAPVDEAVPTEATPKAAQ